MIKIENPLDAWLGELPSDWEKRKLKYIFSIKKEIAGEEGYTVLSVTQQGIVPKNMDAKGQFAADYSKYQLVNKGDFVMNHMDLLTGWVDISEYEGVTSPDYRVFKISDDKNFCAEYYKYIFQLCYKHKIFYGLGQGVSGFGRWRLPADMFLNFVLPVPKAKEQEVIARFLDKKISIIDYSIVETQKSLDEYKALKAAKIHEIVTAGIRDNINKKDSGFFDIGEIPFDWRVARIKDVYNVVCGATPKDDIANWENGDIHWIGPADMPMFGYISEGKRDITKEGYESCGTSLVPSGSIVLSTRAPIGKICIAENELCTNQGCKSLVKKKDTVDNRYVAYYLFSILERLQQDGTGVTFKELSTKNLAIEPLVLPSREEQEKIADILDEECEFYDNLLSEKTKLIEELEKYKVSIVYETVTGKRRVV